MRLDQGTKGLEIPWEVRASIREAEKINTIRDEGVKVRLKFDISKTVGIVKCNAKLIRG